MTLAIDVGNSNIKFGVYRDGKWGRRYRVRTVLSKTPDEYALSFSLLLAQGGLSLRDVDVACVSCVVPPLTQTLKEMLEDATGRSPIIVGPGVKTGVRIVTENPQEVGSDLVVNAAAARARGKGACVVIAFGTALTFTGVSESGDLLGVAIAPGLSAAAESLFKNTAQLKLFEFVEPERALGRNSAESLRSGFLFGFAGLVESLTGRILRELGGAARVVTTGAQAKMVMPLVGFESEHDPWLTLEGLRIIAERNVGSR
jgi:type III pantothenate kinase